jgi:hypothetical protein
MMTLVLGDLPEPPVTRAPVYELAAPPVGRVVLLSMLSRLALADRLSDLRWERNQGWLTAGNQRVRVAMNARSGGIRYTLRPLAEEEGRSITTSEERLEEIARDFLDRLGRPSQPMALDRITYLRAQTSTPPGELSDVTTLDAGVIFRRTLDGISVIGPGGIAMVRIGTDEEVVGGREVYRPSLGRGPPLDLLSPENAIELLRQRLEARGLDGEVRVTRGLFGYEERGIEERQRRLEPSYAFTVEMSDIAEMSDEEVSYLDVDSEAVEVISAVPTPIA